MKTPVIYHLDDEAQIIERFQRLLNSGIPGARIKGFIAESDFDYALSEAPTVDVFVIDAFLDRSAVAKGVALTEFCRKQYPLAAIILSSSSSDLRVVRDSMLHGADDFIAKDAAPQTIIAAINAAMAKYAHRKQIEDSPSFRYVGKTMRDISERISKINQSAVNGVYIEGESGVGKEVIATLFESTIQKGVPFVKVNCATLAPQLITSELFGHVKGAFTGATGDKEGLLEAADGGWIFLDEIALLPIEAQGALLRALDNQTLRRLGSNKERPVNFRVISATNESLAAKVSAGTFRKDLWQRLCETLIQLPPLRTRRDEIPELVNFFCESMRGGPYTLAPRVMEILKAYDWREGNIRELRNALRAMTERAVDGILTPSSIPAHIWDAVDTAADSKLGIRGIKVTWSGEERPAFDQLISEMLLELIKAEFKARGRLSVRALAKAIGIPKSSMPTKIKAITDAGLITSDELHLMIKSTDSD